MDVNDLLVLTLAALALGTVFWLARRFKRVRDPEIIAAVLPRLYIAIVYLAIVAFDPEIETARLAIRLGVLVLLIFENTNHYFKWRAGK